MTASSPLTHIRAHTGSLDEPQPILLPVAGLVLRGQETPSAPGDLGLNPNLFSWRGKRYCADYSPNHFPRYACWNEQGAPERREMPDTEYNGVWEEAREHAVQQWRRGNYRQSIAWYVGAMTTPIPLHEDVATLQQRLNLAAQGQMPQRPGNGAGG